MSTKKNLFCGVAISVLASLIIWGGCAGNNVTGLDGGYTLTVSANPPAGGSVSRDLAQASYKTGASVTVTASANPGYAFIGWAGALVSTDNPATVTMGDNLTLVADFQRLADSEMRFTVSFNANGGSPEAIGPVIVDSGSALGAQFPENPTRMGYDFVGWLDGGDIYTLSTVITKNAALTADWMKKRFTVTFNTEGGAPSAINSVTVDSGEAVGANFPENPTKAGYDFSAWFDWETGETYTGQTAIAKNVTLAAEWTVAVAVTKQFTVSFNTNGGTPGAISPIAVDSGFTLGASFPANPTMKGSVFAGWFDALEQYLANTAITRDVTLAASWVPAVADTSSLVERPADTAKTVKSFMVSFNTDGGSPSMISSVQVDSGKALGTSANLPADPTKAGNVFGGWVDKATGELYYADAIIVNDIKLTAKWIPIDPSTTVKHFTVSFDTDGGSPGMIASATVDSGMAFGTGIGLPTADPTRTGYNFGGWFDGATQYKTNTVITHDVMLTAKWVVKSFIVSFNTNGGSPSNIGPVTVDSGSYFVSPIAPTRMGYTFEGWFDGQSEYRPSTRIVGNVTLTAKWTIKSYSISFDTDGGTPSTIRPFSVDSGTTFGIVVPTEPTKRGYDFVGWFDGSVQYTSNTAIGKDVRLVAVWANTVIHDKRDGQTYNTVRIGDQTWMASNLNYNDADAWCYDNDANNCAIYGKLYTWNSAKSSCPGGWHLPTSGEWGELVANAGDKYAAGWTLKSESAGGTDDYGFSALLSGSRSPYIVQNGVPTVSKYENLGTKGIWWSATVFAANGGYAYYWYVSDGIGYMGDEVSQSGSLFSVRCVQDEP
jgi:uncharacterized protein (TIGR02145 family)/uncharacterized repeat protein (TIGR02543 family)